MNNYKGVRFCLVFSLSGFLFLWIIATLLGGAKSSLYIKVEGREHSKKDLSNGVANASLIYLGMFILTSCWSIRLSPTCIRRLIRKRFFALLTIPSPDEE